MKQKAKKKISKILMIIGKTLAVIGILFWTIAGVMAIEYKDLTTYNQIRYIGQTMESPEQIDNWLWRTNNYTFSYYKRPLSVYWETRQGDCTEIASVEYIMFKSIGYKARISHGYLNGEKHDYTEYWNNNQWNSPNPLIIRKGRGIW